MIFSWVSPPPPLLTPLPAKPQKYSHPRHRHTLSCYSHRNSNCNGEVIHYCFTLPFFHFWPPLLTPYSNDPTHTPTHSRPRNFLKHFLPHYNSFQCTRSIIYWLLTHSLLVVKDHFGHYHHIWTMYSRSKFPPRNICFLSILASYIYELYKTEEKSRVILFST